MIHDVSSKSTGQLVDELVTNAFKTAFATGAGRPTAEFDARRGLLRGALDRRLRDALDRRFGGSVADVLHEICVEAFGSVGDQIRVTPIIGLTVPYASALLDLCAISLATWRAQEVVMSDADDVAVALAARTAQRCNARRTALIRVIDGLLGEADITITTKTYG